jgi:hypothetical protein
MREMDASARGLLEFFRTPSSASKQRKTEQFVDSGSSDGFLGTRKNIVKSGPNARRNQC